MPLLFSIIWGIYRLAEWIVHMEFKWTKKNQIFEIPVTEITWPKCRTWLDPEKHSHLHIYIAYLDGIYCCCSCRKQQQRKLKTYKKIQENIFPLRKRQRCKKFQTDGKASADISTTSDCQVEKGGRHGGWGAWPPSSLVFISAGCHPHPQSPSSSRFA